MALITFSFKIDDALDPDVVAWLKASENRSIDIRKALRHYLDLPPRNEDTLPVPTPQPSGGVDQQTMDRLVKVLERLEKRLDAPQTIGRYSLNQAAAEDEAEPEADPNLANATQAFLGMFG